MSSVNIIQFKGLIAFNSSVLIVTMMKTLGKRHAMQIKGENNHWLLKNLPASVSIVTSKVCPPSGGQRTH